MGTVELNVAGMRCTGCTGTVEKALKAVAGVTAVEVRFDLELYMQTTVGNVALNPMPCSSDLWSPRPVRGYLISGPNNRVPSKIRLCTPHTDAPYVKTSQNAPIANHRCYSPYRASHNIISHHHAYIGPLWHFGAGFGPIGISNI